MQEELERKMVVISLQTARLTGRVFKLALQKFLAELEKGGQIPKTFRGKQTVRHLVGQNAGVSSIEITDGNIRSFERSARRYGVDFALKKDTTVQPPRYLVFFKSRDADALTAAFRDYTASLVKKSRRPSVRRRLAQTHHQAARPSPDRVRERQAER